MTAAARLSSDEPSTTPRAEAPLTRGTLADDLRTRVFPAPARSQHPLIGAEVEIIPVDSVTRRPLPLDGSGSTLDLLRRAGAEAGWCERRSANANVPEIRMPDGGRITFEPGGQIEISSAPNESLTALARQLRETVARIASAAEPGVELLAVGIDPETPVEGVVPQLDAERYRRMLRHFDRIGSSGARMMRQTASFQVCVDGGEQPELTWRVLNAIAPYMVAIFANSPRYQGRDTGHASFRAHIWRTLDPRRTGILGTRTDIVDEYLDFALGAPAFLMPDVGGRAAPFAHWLSGGATTADWCAHLSTLFPEVRPRGYFELRSSDVVAPEWYVVPLALIGGIVYHPPTLATVAEILGCPDPDLLERAGRVGLAEPAIGDLAPTLCHLAVGGCRALGNAFIESDDLDTVERFFDRYTRQRRSPKDD